MRDAFYLGRWNLYENGILHYRNFDMYSSVLVYIND
jgi:hypothetical protein